MALQRATSPPYRDYQPSGLLSAKESRVDTVDVETLLLRCTAGDTSLHFSQENGPVNESRRKDTTYLNNYYCTMPTEYVEDVRGD